MNCSADELRALRAEQGEDEDSGEESAVSLAPQVSCHPHRRAATLLAGSLAATTLLALARQHGGAPLWGASPGAVVGLDSEALTVPVAAPVAPLPTVAVPPLAASVPPPAAAVPLPEVFPDGPTAESFQKGSKPFKAGHEGTLTGTEAGELIINEDGKLNKYYLPGAEVIDNGTSVKYTPPYRFYLMKTPSTDYSKASNFYKPIFPGKTFSVDITLTNVGCGCNVNFYLVDMPAKSPGNQGDYYCDAQCFDGLGCCAEFDMNEGNDNVQQVTSHACTEAYPGHPDWQCNKWGHPEVKTSTSEFKDGSGAKIDGAKPFTFSQEFRMTGDQLSVITTMTQGSTSVVKAMGPSSELQAMLKDGSLENGMVFVTGYWTASDMNWLDGDSCGAGPESCSKSPAFLSNWRITKNNSPVPRPSPSPSPSPSQSPSPSPNAVSSCCWGSCGNCADEGAWCNTEERCSKSCTGKWLECPSDGAVADAQDAAKAKVEVDEGSQSRDSKSEEADDPSGAAEPPKQEEKVEQSETEQSGETDEKAAGDVEEEPEGTTDDENPTEGTEPK